MANAQRNDVSQKSNAHLTKFSPRADLIIRRTYSRPKADGSYETWEEIVSRVISHQKWLWETARGDRPLNAAQRAELDELREVLLRREASVSGRTLWLGGTEVAKKRQASQFNCLAGETTVITRDCGAVPLAKALGAREVLNSHGEWVSAEIKSFGKQDLAAYRFGHNSHSFTIYATAEHRWRLSSGEFVPSKYLNVGDKIPFVMPARQINDPVDYKLGVQHGLIYGDGSERIDGTYIIRLCADAEDLLPWFNDHSVTYPPSTNGDPLVYISKKAAWDKLKNLPTPEKSDSYLIGFIRGWLAADGSVSKAGQVTLCAGPQEEDWLRQWGAKFGYYCAGFSSLPAETNFGIRNKESRNIRLMKASVLPEDFIIRRKAERVNTVEMEYTFYGVDRHQPIRHEEVFCAVVPSTQDFVLGNGMLTGNCSFLRVESVHDVVDAFWLLLQGCGVGFEPVVGTLNGFTKPARVELMRSQRHLLEEKHGREVNTEYWHLNAAGETVWQVQIGDSAEAWAKSVGKILANKKPFDVLMLDFTQIRPAGERLRGYGWISSGDETFSAALQRIAAVLNARAGQLLTRIDILDIMNHLGTTLSSRRSAEIALVPYGDAEWQTFATAKRNFWEKDETGQDNMHRQQSNNSLLFALAPTDEQLEELFAIMQAAGGSEPGFINGKKAKENAPWFAGVNPCGEILLPNKGFCNLCEIDLGKFAGRTDALMRVAYLLGRANYRQTCVNLEDGILQRAWHENNEFLRLCGVGLTGVVRAEMWLSTQHLMDLRVAANSGAHSMAAELNLPPPKAVTTIKPSGTLSKIMDTTEGVHRPLGKFIFNNVRFGRHDPLLAALRAANYRVFDDPSSSDAVLVTFPVKYDDVAFDSVNGKPVNFESARSQLERYRRLMTYYVDHNCSVSIYYSPDEIPQILEWFRQHWNSYIGVSFIYRTDPSKTAADLGYLYLPQEVVTEEVYRDYVAQLKPVKLGGEGSEEMTAGVDDFAVDTGDACATGACPIR